MSVSSIVFLKPTFMGGSSVNFESNSQGSEIKVDDISIEYWLLTTKAKIFIKLWSQCLPKENFGQRHGLP